MVKVGDRVVVRGYPEYVVRISRIYQENPQGLETKWGFETSRIILILDWGELGKSKVPLHERDRTWFTYSDSN